MTSISSADAISGVAISDVQLRPETPADLAVLTALHEAVFGPGRFAKTAFRLREGKAPRYDLSRLAWHEQTLVGAVRMTDVTIGGKGAILLGPLCVHPDLKSRGLGRALMSDAVQASWDAGEQAIVLVGDAAYYEPFGFGRAKGVELPGPADPARTLIAVRDGSAENWFGRVA